MIQAKKALALVLLSSLIATPASAGFWDRVRQTGREIDLTNKNSSVREGFRNVDLTNKNSAVREAGRRLDAYRIDGLESAAKVCQVVGPKCADGNFLNVYAHMKTAANVGIFRGADACAAFVHSAKTHGVQSIQLFAAAKGVAVPPQLLSYGASSYEAHGYDSCKVMYGTPNFSNLVATEIDKQPITVAKQEYDDYKKFESEITIDSDVPVSSSNPQSSSNSNPQISDKGVPQISKYEREYNELFRHFKKNATRMPRHEREILYDRLQNLRRKF